jgi:peroxiredoxin
MIKYLTYLTILALSATLSLAGVEVGSTAPDFTLTNASGKTTTLNEYKGKTVVLEWTNYECPFVVKHYSGGNMQNLQKEFTGKGVVWLSIVSSAKGKQGYLDPAQASSAAEKQKINATALLLDPDGKVGTAYGAKTTPHMFIVSAEGKVIYAGAIDDKPSTNATDIASSQNYVKTALEEVLAGKPVTTSSTKSYGCSVKY